MVYIQRGLSKQDRAELEEFCEETAHYYKVNDDVDFSKVSDEELLDYSEKFEQMDYENKGFSGL